MKRKHAGVAATPESTVGLPAHACCADDGCRLHANRSKAIATAPTMQAAPNTASPTRIASTSDPIIHKRLSATGRGPASSIGGDCVYVLVERLIAMLTTFGGSR